MAYHIDLNLSNKLGVKQVLLKFATSRDMPVKVQKEDGDENIRKLSCYRIIVVKKEGDYSACRVVFQSFLP